LKEDCQQCDNFEIVQVTELRVDDTICTLQRDDNSFVEFTVFAAPGYHYVYVKTTKIAGLLFDFFTLIQN